MDSPLGFFQLHALFLVRLLDFDVLPLKVIGSLPFLLQQSLFMTKKEQFQYQYLFDTSKEVEQIVGYMMYLPSNFLLLGAVF